jgi:hypothetical protein
MNDITVKGWVVGETDMAWWFLWEDRPPGFGNQVIPLPKSQVAVVKGVTEDEVTMPLWLAEAKNLA